MSTAVMKALVTTQGTAMPETAMCAEHFREEDTTRAQAVSNAIASGDWDGGDFHDCTGNDELACIECGAKS